MNITKCFRTVFVLVYLTIGSLSSSAQTTVKVYAPVATAKSPERSAASKRTEPLSLTCGATGLTGKRFLVARAAGGKPPYKFTVNDPTVTFNSKEDQAEGSLLVEQSTLKAQDTATFTVMVTDNATPPSTGQLTCSINIVAGGPGALDVECPRPAYVNTVFAIADVYGGTPPFTYAESGLPSSLVLDPKTGFVTGGSTSGSADVTVSVTDKNGTSTQKCLIEVKDADTRFNCSIFPVNGEKCVGYGAARNVNVNAFWGTNSGFVFFNQVKSIYNGASNSATVSADIGTLNFPFGMQLNVGSNIQAGSAPPTAVSTGAIPTLSPSGAAQAAQNMLYGGTIVASGAFPVFAMGGNKINSPGGSGGMLDVAMREGVDVQSFKSGTSVGLTSPSSHSSFQIEGYAQVNSTNLPLGGGATFAGALFIGGSYGYSYTSHQYIRNYGIANPGNMLGQISAGVILNGVAKLALSKAFGPSQTFIDGTVTPTPTTPTTTNNFKTWSFELSYQSAPPGSK